MEICTKVHPWGPTPETDNGAQPWGLPQGSDPSCSPSTVLLGAWLGTTYLYAFNNIILEIEPVRLYQQKSNNKMSLKGSQICFKGDKMYSELLLMQECSLEVHFLDGNQLIGVFERR